MEAQTLLEPGSDIPSKFLCPITHELMKDPVIAMDGHVYDSKALDTWMSRNTTSPITRQTMPRTIVRAKFVLDEIEAWCLQNNHSFERRQIGQVKTKKRLSLDQFYDAIYEGDFDKVVQFVHNGLEVKSDRNHALHVAICCGDLDIVEFLVENGADIHEAGVTALLIPRFKLFDDQHIVEYIKAQRERLLNDVPST